MNQICEANPMLYLLFYVLARHRRRPPHIHLYPQPHEKNRECLHVILERIEGNKSLVSMSESLRCRRTGEKKEKRSFVMFIYAPGSYPSYINKERKKREMVSFAE